MKQSASANCIRFYRWDGAGAEDIMLAVFRYLDIRRILSMRQCCREFNRISRVKQLWVSILQRDVLQDAVTSPFTGCIRSLNDLSAQETEAVAIHLLRLQRRNFAPVPKIIRIDQERPVTWVHLVHGRWLLVATSDKDASCIALWKIADILRDAAHAKPASQAFLPAAVRDGVVDVQDDALVIALSIFSERPTVNIVSIRLDTNDLVFVHLSDIKDVSHTRALIRRNWVGCAVYDGLSIPCVLNWVTGALLPFYPRPNMRGGCIAMSAQDQYIVLVFPDRVDIFTLGRLGS